MFEMIKRLKAFKPEGYSIEEMLCLIVFAHILRAEYDNQRMPLPEWLSEGAFNRLSRVVQAKRVAALEAALEIAREKDAALRTTDEVRTQVKGEIEQMEAALEELNRKDA